MKKYISVSVVLGFVLTSFSLMQSCSKAPAIVACIADAPTTASLGATLSFTSCTPNATGAAWKFGDGATATGDSVSHIYTNSGNYTVSLTVTNGSASNTKSFGVTILPNSWTFKGANYAIDSVVASPIASTLTATGTIGSNNANLIFRFYPFPTATGTYSYTIFNAENGNSAQNQMFILLNRDSSGIQSQYGSTGGGPVVATVVVGGGKIGVALPLTEMVNLNNLNDSTTISGAVTQTQ